VAHVATRLPEAVCAVARAEALPLAGRSFDVVVAGLVLNFTDVEAALAEMRRVARSLVAAYVWDYGGGIERLRAFWAAAELDPADAGLRRVEVGSIEIAIRLRDLDDRWRPFLGGQGPAPAYCARVVRGGAWEERRRPQDGWPVSCGQRSGCEVSRRDG